MKLENHVFGSLSFAFLVGYMALILCLILLYSTQSPIYHEVAVSLQKIPLSTILLASPLAVVIGIIINSIRVTINKFILRRQLYEIEKVSNELKDIICPVINEVLHTHKTELVQLNEHTYTTARTILIPRFDVYSIKSRWLHDFFDSTIYIAITCIVIVSLRAIVKKTLVGIDFYVLLVMTVSAVFAFASLKDLKIEYTKAELSVIVDEKNRMAAKQR